MPATFTLLTGREASELLAALDAGWRTVAVSLDLGRTESAVSVRDGEVVANDLKISRRTLTRIARSPNQCFEIGEGAARPVSVFSRVTGWARSLLPTEEAPTTLVAGFPMHRIRGTTPLADSRAKVVALGRPRGRVLDTATGLGYTAIELAKTALRVTSVEIDPAALELARRNPWSAPLFESANIDIVVGDVAEVVTTLDTGAFAAILHDPPTVQLAGALYARGFYQELRRLLKPGGRLFHYVGNPTSAAGVKVTGGVMRRLKEAGFQSVRRRERVFGVSAIAPGRCRSKRLGKASSGSR